MKKLVVCILMLSVMLCACGKEEPKQEEPQPAVEQAVHQLVGDLDTDVIEVPESDGEVDEDPTATVPDDVDEGFMIGTFDKIKDMPETDATTDDAYNFCKTDSRGYYVYDFEALGESGEIGNHDYTGRFAYPTVKTGGLLKNMVCSYISDTKCIIDFSDDGEYQGVITLDLGQDNFALWKEDWTPIDGVVDPVSIGEHRGTEVLCQDVSKDSYYTVYKYNLGCFTVELQRISNDEPFTDKELEAIMDCITLGD